MSTDAKARPLPDAYAFEDGEYEWIETAAVENLKGRRETADVLAKEAATTLTVLLAGAGGSWAVAIKLLDEAATGGTVAAFAAAVWLTLDAMWLVFSCLRIKPLPPLYNQPERLLRRIEQKESFDVWRYGELKNLDDRIVRASKRNEEVAWHLNTIRLLAALTPVVAALVVAVFFWLRR